MAEVRVSDKPVCDFCSSPEPRWLFRCRNYVATDMLPNHGALPPNESVGGWLACHKCAVYVQRNDWNGLARRVTADGGINPTVAASIETLPVEFISDGLKRVWREFARNRVGAAVEWRVG